MTTPALDRLSDEQVAHLVRANQDALRSYLGCLGCPAERVDDVVQETFLAFLSKPFEDRGAGATLGYLRTIAKNRYLNSVRTKRRRREVVDHDAVERAWARFAGDDDFQSYRTALDECLRLLGDRSHRALRLRYGDGRSRDHIAAALELSDSGVKSVLARALRTLRDCIERKLES